MTPERWQQIAQLLEAALEREPQQRVALLDETCAEDEELRREVLSLLATREEMGDFLTRTAFEIEAARATVVPGQHVAHFEVLSPLGAGAMGEVYLARDMRLDRKVALKLLPARFTQDVSRLRRFEREARAASLLNHPNIITVYEVGQDEERHFIATEFVEGVTLRQRLKEGHITPGEAIRIARQIVGALEAAHAAGIVHRDIKPENVMLRQDGAVKVLDFGIAKLIEQRATGGGNAAISHYSTEQGTVIGTPGYMSPEQARGLDVDARTDVFSLGVVLYEMIAGCAPFRGATHADVIVALLEREPEPLAGNRAQLDEIVATALAKNCDRRYQTATELLRALESCPEEPASHERQTKQQLRTSTQNVPPNARAVRVKRGRRIAIWLLGGIGGIALAWLLYRSNQKPAVWAERSQLHISQFISKKVGAGGALSRPAFSPDGKQIAYSLSEEGGSHLWVKALATQAETRITDGPWLDSDPVWSPDGQKIAFFSNRDGRRDLWVVALAPQPGHPALLKKLDLFAENLITWKKNQQSDLLYLEANGDLFALNPVSTQLSRLTKLDSAHPGTDFSLSPKQDKVAYRDTVNAEYRLLIKPLPNGEATVLLKGSEPIRSPVWFEDGEKIAFCANRTGSYQVYALWLDDRRIEQITFNNDNYSALALSPDGNTMAINATTENANVFASDVHDRTEVQHFSARGLQVLPALSLDEKMMIFQAAGSNEQGAETIFLKPAIPADAAQRLTRGFNGRWSPNGEAVAFLRDSSAKTELWCVNLRDKAEQRLASGIAYASYSPMPFYLAYAEYDWSPDGTKITYSSKKSGQSNLWQVSADAAQDTRLTYNNDNQITLYSPRWAADGSKLAYLSGARAIGEKRPSIQSINLLESGKSSILFQREAALRILGWAANGQELLIASGQRQGIAINNQIELLSINVSNRALRALSTLKDAYLPSLTLSGDGRSLALVSRRNGRDNVEVISLVNGSARQITNNLDPTTYYAALSWDTAGRRLFYSKQEKWENSFLIEKRK